MVGKQGIVRIANRTPGIVRSCSLKGSKERAASIERKQRQVFVLCI